MRQGELMGLEGSRVEEGGDVEILVEGREAFGEFCPSTSEVFLIVNDRNRPDGSQADHWCRSGGWGLMALRDDKWPEATYLVSIDTTTK